MFFGKGVLTLKLYLCPVKRFSARPQFFFLFFFVCSATVSRSWVGALPLIGGRLTCLRAKKPSCRASPSLLKVKKKGALEQYSRPAGKKETNSTNTCCFLCCSSDQTRTCLNMTKLEGKPQQFLSMK